MNHYNLVFDGSISDGYKVDEVKGNLAALFKVDKKKIDRFFSKQPVVLKKELDHDSAVKYQKAFLKAGAMCKVKAAPLHNTPQLPEPSIPPPLPNHLPGDMNERGKHSVSEQKLEKSSEKKSVKGVGDIIAGIVLIGIGFAFGGSIFMGNPGLLDYIFDGLGIFWIGSGIYKMVR